MRAVKKEWLLGMLCVLSGVMLMVMHPVQAQAGQADRAAYRAVFDASYTVRRIRMWRQPMEIMQMRF